MLLAELDNLPIPAGADPRNFEFVRSAFRNLVLAGGVDLRPKGTSAGLGTEVTDLEVMDLGGGAVRLSWTYRHLGDYDQNSEVNVSDISPVGLYFNAVASGANWSNARVADGDDNGEVNVSDITAIGQNFGSIVSGYLIESTATPGDPGSWAEAEQVAFGQGAIAPGETFRTFTVDLVGQAAGLSYRVQAQTTSSAGPDYDEVEDNDTISTPNQLPDQGVANFTGSLGSGTGYAGYDGDGDDLFRISADSGDQLDITLALNGSTGDIDLYLLNASGDTLLTSLGIGNTEHIFANVTSGGTFLIALSCVAGYSDYTLEVEVSSGSGFEEPPTETFVDYSQVGDTAERKWLLNCYRVLPPWQDADRCLQNATFAEWATEILALTNIERANEGLPALVFDPHLELVAQAHARDMALRQYFSHNNIYGMTPFDRLDAVDRPPYTAGTDIAGENLFAGRAVPPAESPAMAVEWWMNSPDHRDNILNPNVTHLGVGVYYHTGDPSTYYAYFCQLFANWAVDPGTHDWLEPEEVPAP